MSKEKKLVLGKSKALSSVFESLGSKFGFNLNNMGNKSPMKRSLQKLPINPLSKILKSDSKKSTRSNNHSKGNSNLSSKRLYDKEMRKNSKENQISINETISILNNNNNNNDDYIEKYT